MSQPSETLALLWQVAPMFDAPATLKGYVGEEDGFDPLALSTFFDMVRSASNQGSPTSSGGSRRDTHSRCGPIARL